MVILKLKRTLRLHGNYCAISLMNMTIKLVIDELVNVTLLYEKHHHLDRDVAPFTMLEKHLTKLHSQADRDFLIHVFNYYLRFRSLVRAIINSLISEDSLVPEVERAFIELFILFLVFAKDIHHPSVKNLWQEPKHWVQDKHTSSGLSRLGLCALVQVLSGLDLATKNINNFENELSEKLLLEWTQHLDIGYIKTLLQQSQNRFQQAIVSIQAQYILEESNSPSVPQRTMQTRTKPKTTQPQPFRLTQPRVRSIGNAIPVPIPNKPIRPRSVPVSSQISHAMQQVIRGEQERERRRERAAEDHQKAPTLRALSRERTPRTEQEQINDPNVFRVKPRRVSSISSMVHKAPVFPVRKTTAAMLREDALIKKQIESEKKKLEDECFLALAGTLSAADLSQHLELLRQKEQEMDKAQQEKNRLMAQLAREEALLAKEATMARNRASAEQMKHQAEKIKAKLDKMRADSLREKFMLVNDIQHARSEIAKAKSETLEKKRQEALSLQRELEQLQRQQDEENQREMHERMDRIKEMRALEIVATEARRELAEVGQFDPTTTAQRGIFTEMSFLELKERLNMLKIQAKEEETKKKELVDQQRKIRDEKIREISERIEQYRQANSFHGPESEISSITDPRVQQQEKINGELRQRLEMLKQQRSKNKASKQGKGFQLPVKKGITEHAPNLVDQLLSLS